GRPGPPHPVASRDIDPLRGRTSGSAAAVCLVPFAPCALSSVSNGQRNRRPCADGQSPVPDECRQHRLSRGAETSPSRGRSSGARLLAQPPDEKRPLLRVETAPDPVALAG